MEFLIDNRFWNRVIKEVNPSIAKKIKLNLKTKDKNNEPIYRSNFVINLSTISLNYGFIKGFSKNEDFLLAMDLSFKDNPNPRLIIIESAIINILKKEGLPSNVDYIIPEKIDEDFKLTNKQLFKDLIENINKNLKDVEGYLYLKTWEITDQTKWFKVGITNDLTRRDSEQNVLPVASKTLATAKVASMDHARAIEKSIHKVIEKFRINDAQNKELFRLENDALASLLELFKKIDLRNK